MTDVRQMLLAWTLLLALAASFYLLAFEPMQRASVSAAAQVSDLRERIARLESLEQERADLVARLASAAVEDSDGTTTVTPAAATPAAASANLQERLTRAIEAKRLTRVSLELLTPPDRTDARRVSVKVTLEGGLPALRDLLVDLELGQPRVFVDEAALQVASGQQRGGMLRATLTVSALVAAAPGPAGDST